MRILSASLGAISLVVVACGSVQDLRSPAGAGGSESGQGTASVNTSDSTSTPSGSTGSGSPSPSNGTSVTTGEVTSGAGGSGGSGTTVATGAGGGGGLGTTLATGAGGSGGSQTTVATGGGGGAVDCTVHVPPSGAPFTLHVHNAGTSQRGVVRGCGNGIPIVIETPSGIAALGLGTTGALVCDGDGSCESAYRGKVSTVCSDCGLGQIDVLAPGGTTDYPWNHVGRFGDLAPAACSGVAGGVNCLRAIAVAPTASQVGALSYCSSGSISFAGGCEGDTLTLTFTVDTTQAEATIDLP